ncbi:unannotated protein [freshwater metagenome]|uniref:Unannotated protein n=1 Tax=freshwater metagenome TaxID=449393 RepID=A0A6J7GR29_9ZZZZ|nr:linear amide C-N hydrolase [Actinomycetota bacterium]
MCTNFKVPVAEDGSVVVGRSLDYPAQFPVSLCVLTTGQSRRALGPVDATAAKEWTTRFGVVGLALFGQEGLIFDGLNSNGLSAHTLYMVGGFFHPIEFRGDGTDVSQLELTSYLLSTCGSVADVRAAVAEINIWGWDGGLPFMPPVHVLVHDVNESVAIEFRPDGVVVVDNPTSVGTNSPYLEWHLLNMNNHVGFSSVNPDGQAIAGGKIRPMGAGWGLHGLPGDYSGPSRFVRALVFTSLADTPATGKDAEMLALHILNAFDIPAGVVKEPGPNHSVLSEVTYADTICNLSELRFAYRALNDPIIYVVDLKETDFTGDPRTTPISRDGQFTLIEI